MAFGDSLRARIDELRKLMPEIDETIKKSQKIATAAAVEEATKLTPPNENTGPRGAGTITGQTKSNWAVASIIDPVERTDGEWVTVLGNNLQHVSYLNDGHFMDQHFVPGLVINPYSGLLEKVDPSLGGITVGTQTEYVPGLYMREQALDVYRDTLDRLLLNDIRRLFT